jgi:hypothetical protein
MKIFNNSTYVLSNLVQLEYDACNNALVFFKGVILISAPTVVMIQGALSKLSSPRVYKILAESQSTQVSTVDLQGVFPELVFLSYFNVRINKVEKLGSHQPQRWTNLRRRKSATDQQLR